ncbi:MULTISPECIES: TlpA family protein disulfide reductase [Sphingobacterium]|uniref:TlpA family protein disulfide reductase n=1 Tax=Sphingobacterium TaxID=28453 RepID=UPI0013D9E418|nr:MULTISPECIES: TlpA disulfide reductase family protein [unclassified Sphingobacterium]
MKRINIVGIIMILLLAVTNSYAQLKIGDTLPDITLQNDKNTEIALHSFQGKTVLVDFWASWCLPCRKANKHLVKLYDKYKKQNFEIVGISIDTESSKWLKAIQQDRLKHQQLIDPKGFDAQSAILFGVEALPAAYLFDSSGKLIAINPSEEQIISQIKK